VSSSFGEYVLIVCNGGGKGRVRGKMLHMATIRVMTGKRGMFVWNPSITLQDLCIYLGN